MQCVAPFLAVSNRIDILPALKRGFGLVHLISETLRVRNERKRTGWNGQFTKL